ncbi:MAG: hypothetical protein HRU69_04905 [Flammeovirgaceae bacterium]|nr:MAG: hypothetical protein HRU69_04905 [Flammeovirgaceae bacterium]
MMHRALLLYLFILAACGGNLSDEQRRQLRDAQQLQAIRKIPEAELLTEAFDRGRKIVRILQSRQPRAQQLDSISKAYLAVIRWRELSASNALDIEQQVIEAYLAAAGSGAPVADNVQRISTDSLLYTMPLTRYRPDSVLEVTGVWSIRMAIRDVVLGMNNQ